jgi:hypothetical protein
LYFKMPMDNHHTYKVIHLQMGHDP